MQIFADPALRLEIQKPWVPGRTAAQDSPVEIRRSRHTVYIAPWLHMGDKMAPSERGSGKTSKPPGSSVEKVSDFIRTEPYGVTEQDEFLNGVLEMETLPDTAGTVGSAASDRGRSKQGAYPSGGDRVL